MTRRWYHAMIRATTLWFEMKEVAGNVSITSNTGCKGYSSGLTFLGLNIPGPSGTSFINKFDR
jgi:hypothetical protein